MYGGKWERRTRGRRRLPAGSLPALLVAVALLVAGAAGAKERDDREPSPRAARCDGSKPTIVGTKRDDRGRRKLKGTPRDDVIAAGRGDDLIVASGGDDVVCGGPDDDKLKGGNGRDALFGEGGGDALDGGAGSDACDGGPGRNRLRKCERGAPGTANANPTDIAIDNSRVAENEPAGTVIGSLSTTDRDAGDAHVYSLVAGAGDNAEFEIDGDRLRTAQPLNFEGGATRSVRIRTTDRAGGAFEKDLAITVTDANDPPADIALSPAAVPENEPAGTAVGSLTTADEDSTDAHSYALAGGPGDGDNSRFQVAGGELRTTQSFNFEAARTHSVRVRSTDAGGISVEEQLTISIDDVADAPVANPDSFAAVGNTGLFVGTARPANQAGREVSGSLLANDTPASLVAEAVTNAATDQGGTITIEPDGNFTYHPQAGDTGTDTFTYRACDSSPCDAANPTATTATLSLPITGEVWYLRNDSPPGGDGTSDGPFDTLAEAEAAAGAGDTVYVFDGDGTSTNLVGGYTMDAGERLLGETAALEVSSHALFPGTPGARPTMTAAGEDVVSLATNTTLDGFDIDPAGAGGGISGSGISNFTVANVDVRDQGTPATQPGLELVGSGGSTSTVSDLVVDNGAIGATGATGVRVSSSTVAFDPASSVTIETTGAKGLDVSTTNLGSSQFDAITVEGSSVGALSLTNSSGAVLGDGAGTDLDLETTAGAQPAFALSNGGVVSVATAGQDDVSATGGPAVQIDGANASSSLAFDQVSSTNSATDGIDIAGFSGAFNAAAGTIAGAAGISFDLDGGNGAIDYPGNLEDGSGQAAEITRRSGGAVNLTGSVSDDDDAGGGISLSSNTGGTSTFSGTKTLSTGASSAIAMSANTGHTLALTGGALVVNATSGAGVTATGGGTLRIAGTANTISTGTGTALNVTSTTIGTGGLNFRSLSSNGAASGIVLNGTGSTAGLVVAGNGGSCTSAGTCTGGAIQNSTGPGLNVTSVGGGVALTRMSVNNGADDGLRAVALDGLELSSSRITGNGNAVGEHGIDATGLTGGVSLDNATVTGSAESNIQVVNDSGSLEARISGGTYGQNSPTLGNDGILLDGTGSGSMTLQIQGTTFTDNRGDHVQISTDASNTVTQNLSIADATMETTAGAAPTVLGGGITVSPGGNANVEATITDSTIQEARATAIQIDPAGGGASLNPTQLDATIARNTIGTEGVANSGSESANGIGVISNGLADVDALVEDNIIREYANSAGIFAVQNDGDGSLDLTAKGNLIEDPGTFATNAILARTGAIATDSGTTCLDLGSSTVAADENTLHAGGANDGDPIETDIRIQQGQETTVRMPGYSGSAFDNTAVGNYVRPRNDLGGTPSASATSSGVGGSGFFNTNPAGSACNQP